MNLLDTYKWCSGENNQTIPFYFRSSATCELTKTYSIIGDYSVKYSATSDTGNRWIRLSQNTGNDTTTTYYLELDAYNPNTSSTVYLAVLDNTETFLNTVSLKISVNTKFEQYTLSIPFVEGTTKVLISIVPQNNNKSCYVDNLKIYKR